MSEEIDLTETKTILLDMLKEIDAFCQKSGIEYFLVGGTLLGAIRHNGFIPWDDDIDIGMKRVDYERFIRTFKSISGNIDVLDYHNSEAYIWPSAKAVDNRTILIENNHDENAIGIFIDIFPLDGVSGSYNQAVSKQKSIQKWRDILTLRTLAIDKNRPFYKNAIVLCGRVLNLIPSRVLIKHIEKLSRKDENSICAYMCNFAGAWGEREIINIHYFDRIEKHWFENQEFNIPSEFDGYLRTVYGDYMTLPPIEKRVSHHGNIAYWKKNKRCEM